MKPVYHKLTAVWLLAKAACQTESGGYTLIEHSTILAVKFVCVTLIEQSNSLLKQSGLFACVTLI